MECTDQTYVTGYKIWQHELEWLERKAARQGYLFFGAPNERSTAVPPRDFYLYFIQPFDAAAFQGREEARRAVPAPDANRTRRSETALKSYAAALDLASTASGHAKATYESKASSFLRDLVQWLQKNMATAFEVTYQGRTKSLVEWAKGKSIRELSGMASHERINFRDLVNTIAGICLEPISRTRRLSTRSSRCSLPARTGPRRPRMPCAPSPGRTAPSRRPRCWTRWSFSTASGSIRTGRSTPSTSSDIAKKKGHGQVVNRSELIQDVLGVEYMAPQTLRLEPEWAVVVLAVAGLCRRGGAWPFPARSSTPPACRCWPGPASTSWSSSSTSNGPRTGTCRRSRRSSNCWVSRRAWLNWSPRAKTSRCKQLQKAVTSAVKRLVLAQQSLQTGLFFWGRSLLAEDEVQKLRAKLDGTKTFLESLQAYTTPGKLKNFRYDAQEVTRSSAMGSGRWPRSSLSRNWWPTSGPPRRISPPRRPSCPPITHWIDKMKAARDDVLAQIGDPAERGATSFRQQTQRRLGDLKKAYVQAYLALHTKARLGVNEDKRKAQLMVDKRLKDLQKLSTIDLMPRQHLADFQNRLAGLKSCFALTEQELDASPVCPHCSFKPAAEPLDGRRGGHARWPGRRAGQAGRELDPDTADQPRRSDHQGQPGPAQARAAQARGRLHPEADSAGQPGARSSSTPCRKCSPG